MFGEQSTPTISPEGFIISEQYQIANEEYEKPVTNAIAKQQIKYILADLFMDFLNDKDIDETKKDLATKAIIITIDIFKTYPDNIVLPEITIEDDATITLEWNFGANKMVVMDINYKSDFMFVVLDNTQRANGWGVLDKTFPENCITYLNKLS
jgi:hypothetical protein